MNYVSFTLNLCIGIKMTIETIVSMFLHLMLHSGKSCIHVISEVTWTLGELYLTNSDDT